MRPESACEHIRSEISAWLDGELDATTATDVEAHLHHCAGCRSYLAAIERARASVRLQVVDPLPDVVDRVVEHVGVRGPIERRRQDRWDHARLAFVAAVVTGLLVLGTSLPGTDRPASLASASEVTRGIRSAAPLVSSYRAGYDIVERGWHPKVSERRFHAELSFSAPDKVRFLMKDLTVYPGGRDWPLNDVELVADAAAWWLREPSGCPQATFPTCAGAGRPIERSVINRQPFDGSTPLPTDLILPLDSVAGSDGLEVLGTERIADRPATRVRIPYLQAERLIAALRPGGSWRLFHPLDRVEIWLDQRDSFPLRITVTPSTSSERREWARSMGYADREGILYEARLTSFDDVVEPDAFVVPATVVTRDAGFRPGGDAEDIPMPRFVAGLAPYDSGTSADDQQVVAWAKGIQWLKVTAGPRTRSTTTIGEPLVRSGKLLYYTPASPSEQRRIELHTRGRTITLESNLERTTLLRVAESVPVSTSAIPSVTTAHGRRIRFGGPELAHRVPFVSSPAWLPPGYAERAAMVSSSANGTTVSVDYHRAEVLDGGTEIRVTHSDAFERLWPSSERYQVVRLRGVVGRYSAGRGELEWMEDGIYRGVSAPGFDLRTILAIAVSLR